MQPLGRLYSKTIIWQGDPNAAPVNNGGPVPTCVVAKPVQFLPWRSTAITRIGDPNAAPVVPAATAAPLVVTPLPQAPARTAVYLAAASADFAFSGPLISTPIPQRSVTTTPIVLRQLQDGAPVSGPSPTPLIILPQQTPARRPAVITYQQFQDGFIAPTTGPVPLSLVVGPDVQAWIKPEVISQQAQPAAVATVAATPAPFVITRARSRHARWQVLVTQAPFVPAGPGPGLLPMPLLPLGLTLNAHSTDLALDAHVTDIALGADQTNLTLND